MTTGQRIHDLRVQRGMTMEELAKEIGLQKAAIYKYESGIVVNLKRSTIEKLADVFGVSPSYIMCLDDGREKEKATIDVVDDDLREYLDTLRERPEMRMLFSTTKTATKEQIEAIVHFIEGMQK